MMTEFETVYLQGLPVRVVDESYPQRSVILPNSVAFETLSWRGRSSSPSATNLSPGGSGGDIMEAHNVDVLFVSGNDADETIQDYQKKLVSNWWQKPYVYLFLSTSLDYVAHKDPRSRVSAFIDSCNTKNAEWMVVYATTTSSNNHSHHSHHSGNNSKEESISKGGRRAFEKLRSAFVTSKGKEGCVVLKIREDGVPEEQSFLDFKSRLKESLRDALETKINAYEEQISQVYASRILPGW